MLNPLFYKGNPASKYVGRVGVTIFGNALGDSITDGFSARAAREQKRLDRFVEAAVANSNAKNPGLVDEVFPLDQLLQADVQSVAGDGVDPGETQPELPQEPATGSPGGVVYPKAPAELAEIFLKGYDVLDGAELNIDKVREGKISVAREERVAVSSDADGNPVFETYNVVTLRARGTVQGENAAEFVKRANAGFDVRHVDSNGDVYQTDILFEVFTPPPEPTLFDQARDLFGTPKNKPTIKPDVQLTYDSEGSKRANSQLSSGVVNFDLREPLLGGSPLVVPHELLHGYFGIDDKYLRSTVRFTEPGSRDVLYTLNVGTPLIGFEDSILGNTQEIGGGSLRLRDLKAISLGYEKVQESLRFSTLKGVDSGYEISRQRSRNNDAADKRREQNATEYSEYLRRQRASQR